MSNWARKAADGARWTESEARAALAAWRSSGETMAAFARRHDIDPQRIGWWRDRLAEPASAALVPVTIANANLATSAVLRVRVDGVEIEILDPECVPAQWLAQLISLSRGGAR
jgi:transposase-like protein